MPKQITKSELMSGICAGLMHECFEHEHHGQFDVTAMRLAAPVIGGELAWVQLDQLSALIASSRVVEEQRVRDLSDKSWKEDPAMCVVIDYDANNVPTVIVIDGHHRAVRRIREGESEMLMWFIPIAKAIRPGPMWALDRSCNWGDPIVNGKIVRKT